MKDMKFKLAAAVVCIVGFFAIIGIAGDLEYTEQVIYRMPQNTYDSIKSLLTKQNGTEPSQSDIAHWWEEHH